MSDEPNATQALVRMVERFVALCKEQGLQHEALAILSGKEIAEPLEISTRQEALEPDQSEQPRYAAIAKFNAKWRVLIESLYREDGKSFEDFLPNIVTLIKSTKSLSMAETGLWTILHSQKVREFFDQNPQFHLATPGTVVPNYIAKRIIFDAARISKGGARTNASMNLKEASKGKALTMRDVLTILDGSEKETNDASAKGAARAREKIGVPRGRGRPRKITHE